MVSKKILGAAIAAVVLSSGSAFAAVPAVGIDLDAATLAPVSYAKETLLSTATTTSTVGSVKFFNIAAPAATIGFTGKIGVGIAATATTYIRVTLTNAVFKTAAVAGNLTIGAAPTAATSVAQGGAVGDAYAVFSVTAPGGGFAQGDIVALALADLAVSGSGDVGYSYSTYETLGTAIGQTSPLYTKTVAGTVKLVDALTVTKTTDNVTANVSDDFKKFLVDAGNTAVLDNFGSFSAVPATALAAATGIQTVAADVYSAAVVTTAGDFSVGTWGYSATSACGAITAATVNTAKTTLADTLAVLNGKPFICVTLPGDKVLNTGTLTSTASFTAVANAQFPQASIANATGAILHNGTTIQVPYVTTYESYKQRLVLVNRGGADAAYTITFTPETGVTATAGTSATGTLKAGKTVILPVGDVVSLVGSTRTAATINVVAISTNIDAATTIVNTAGGGTDTVKLN